MNAIDNFEKALKAANLADNADDFYQVVELENAFVFILCDDGEPEDSMVGVFVKARVPAFADFEGNPRAEGSLEECLAAFPRVLANVAKV